MVVWICLLGTSLWATVGALRSTVRDIEAPMRKSSSLGFYVSGGSDHPTIDMLIERRDGPGSLHRDDQIIRVNGKAAGKTPQDLDSQFAGATGTKVRLTVRSPAGQLSDHIVTRDPNRSARALATVGLTQTTYRVLELLPALLLGFVTLACAIILLMRRPYDRLAPWASITMLCAIAGLTLASDEIAQLFKRPAFYHNTASDIAFSLLTICLGFFPDGIMKPRWGFMIVPLVVITTVIDILSPQVLNNIGYLTALILALVVILIRYQHMPPGVGRQQIRWALFGIAAGLVMFVVHNLLQLVLPNIAYLAELAWFGIVYNLVAAIIPTLIIASVTLSLLRYRLYDADTTISRSIVYGTLTVSILGIFAGSEKIVEILGERYFGEQLGALAGGLGAAVAAVCIGPIHHRVTHWAEHRFRSGLVKLRDGLPVLLADMRETATLNALADAMLARVERGVRAQHGAVIIDDMVIDARDIAHDKVIAWQRSDSAPDRNGKLHVERGDPVFPMRVPLRSESTGFVGWLLLGPRPDGTFYGREERVALRDIASPVARAVAVASERQQLEARRQADNLRRDSEIELLRLSIAELRLHIGKQAREAPVG